MKADSDGVRLPALAAAASLLALFAAPPALAASSRAAPSQAAVLPSAVASLGNYAESACQQAWSIRNGAELEERVLRHRAVQPRVSEDFAAAARRDREAAAKADAAQRALSRAEASLAKALATKPSIEELEAQGRIEQDLPAEITKVRAGIEALSRSGLPINQDGFTLAELRQKERELQARLKSRGSGLAAGNPAAELAARRQALGEARQAVAAARRDLDESAKDADQARQAARRARAMLDAFRVVAVAVEGCADDQKRWLESGGTPEAPAAAGKPLDPMAVIGSAAEVRVAAQEQLAREAPALFGRMALGEMTAEAVSQHLARAGQRYFGSPPEETDKAAAAEASAKAAEALFKTAAGKLAGPSGWPSDRSAAEYQVHASLKLAAARDGYGKAVAGGNDPSRSLRESVLVLAWAQGQPEIPREADGLQALDSIVDRAVPAFPVPEPKRPERMVAAASTGQSGGASAPGPVSTNSPASPAVRVPAAPVSATPAAPATASVSGVGSVAADPAQPAPLAISPSLSSAAQAATAGRGSLEPGPSFAAPAPALPGPTLPGSRPAVSGAPGSASPPVARGPVQAPGGPGSAASVSARSNPPASGPSSRSGTRPPAMESASSEEAVQTRESEPNNRLGKANPIAPNGELEGAIQTRADADWYHVTVPHQGELKVRSIAVPAEIDLIFRVFDESAADVSGWKVPPRPGGETSGTIDLPAAGRYWLEVRDGGDDASSSSPYRLQLGFVPTVDTAEPNNRMGSAQDILIGAPVRANILPRGDADWYRMELDRQGALAIEVTEVSEELDVIVRVWSPDRTTVSPWFNPPRKGGETKAVFDAASPGVYFLEVRDGGDDGRSTKPYVLSTAFIATADTSEPNNQPGAAQPLTLGSAPLHANILPRGDVDWYQVRTESPGALAVTVDQSPEDLDMHFRVWSPDHEVMGSWFSPPRKGGDTVGVVDLKTPGTYLIEVRDGGDDGRSEKPYRLAASIIPVVDVGEPNDTIARAVSIAPGVMVQASIFPRGDVDFYRFEASAPGPVQLRITGVPDGLDVIARMWNSDRASLGSWITPTRKGADTEGRFDLPEAGLYFLEVRDGGDDARSEKPYALQLGSAEKQPVSGSRR